MTSYDLSLDDIRKYNKLKLNINSNFDFNFLINSMPKNIDANRVFTKEIKENLLLIYLLYMILMLLRCQILLRDVLMKEVPLIRRTFKKEF